jgi:hypothetical protein
MLPLVLSILARPFQDAGPNPRKEMRFGKLAKEMLVAIVDGYTSRGEHLKGVYAQGCGSMLPNLLLLNAIIS